VRHFKHPATIIATIALFVALSGVAGAAVSAMISGSQIKNGTIAKKKLSSSAITSLSKLQGVSGAESTSIGFQGAAPHSSQRAKAVANPCPKNTTTPPTWCSTPSTVTFGKKTAVLVTATLDLASNNGSGVESFLGACYAPHGSASLVAVQVVEPDFVAPSGSYFAQSITSVVKGLTPGTYDVGFCLYDQTANASNGYFNVSTVTLQTP
jgi:hypothetical protein